MNVGRVDQDLKSSVSELLLAAVPSIVALALYYSLAIHMRLSLGHWPTDIGERGFPPALVSHARVERLYFVALLWFGMFVFPVELLLCAFVAPLERYLRFLLWSAIIFVASCILRLAVPPAFFYWWID